MSESFSWSHAYFLRFNCRLVSPALPSTSDLICTCLYMRLCANWKLKNKASENIEHARWQTQSFGKPWTSSWRDCNNRAAFMFNVLTKLQVTRWCVVPFSCLVWQTVQGVVYLSCSQTQTCLLATGWYHLNSIVAHAPAPFMWSCCGVTMTLGVGNAGVGGSQILKSSQMFWNYCIAHPNYECHEI